MAARMFWYDSMLITHRAKKAFVLALLSSKKETAEAIPVYPSPEDQRSTSAFSVHRIAGNKYDVNSSNS